MYTARDLMTVNLRNAWAYVGYLVAVADTARVCSTNDTLGFAGAGLCWGFDLFTFTPISLVRVSYAGTPGYVRHIPEHLVVGVRPKHSI